MPAAIDLLPLVPALPLAGVVLLVLFGARLGGRGSGILASTLVGLSFLLSVAIAVEYFALEAVEASHTASEHGAEDAHVADDAGTQEHGDGDESHAEGHEGEGEEREEGHGDKSVEYALGAADHGQSHGKPAGPPVIEQRLWRWMRVQRQLPLTVAAASIAEGEVLSPQQVRVVEVPYEAALGTMEFSVGARRMWSAEQAEGRVARTAIFEGEILSDMNVAVGDDGDRPAGVPEAAGAFAVDVSLRLDALSLLMLLVITGVGFLIHVYSTGYMGHDPDRRRYFTYLNLFVFSMLVLVLGGSFLTLFVGWELVGACSYLLIGFWHKDVANAAAGRKAFVVNRIGDFAFLIGMMLVWTTFGSLSFAEVLPHASKAVGVVGAAIPLLLLAGATGKSAQVPLYVWLPDAMAGPTPVSALIHAATMVTAGVYMIARTHSLFENAPGVLEVVAVVGALTALLAALIALVQVDIKRVLAYSTVSQLGYMFLALGAGAYGVAVFHLMTHAFFKGLLFLGAGSIMHAMEHGFEHAEAHPEALDGIPPEQDMRRMGGLLKRAPITGWTFLIGGLALAGLFPLAGFWSKDEILLETLAHGGPFWATLYGVGLLTAFLTAFYTGRQLILVLFGEPRSEGAAQAAESPANMTIPLVVLAILSIVGGFPVLEIFGAPLPAVLAPVLGAHHAEGGPDKLVIALVATIVAMAGLALAWSRYGRRAPEVEAMGGASSGAASKALWGKLYVDEAYHALFVAPFVALSRVLWRVVDDQLVDGTVNGVGRLLIGLGQGSRRWQSGLVRGYGLSILLGAALVAAWLLVAAL